MHKHTGSYDEIPDGMKRYINHYGCHFNKKLCEEAVSRMTTISSSGRVTNIKPYSKEEVDKLLEVNRINIERGKLYDHVYVANMCKADFLGRSISNEQQLAKYVKDVLDDVDAKDGYVFNRFYADCTFMDEPIEWDDMI